MRARLPAVLAASAALLAAVPGRAQAPDASCAPGDLQALAPWNGVWIAENLQADISGREAPGAPAFSSAMKLLGLDAPWNDEGWKRVDASLRLGSQLKQAGWGYPMMMSTAAPFTIVVSPSQTVIASQYREIRYVFTDGRTHAPEEERWPTSWGDSIGCWEGDTLVIETVGVKYAPEFNYSAPPLSDRARFVERLRLTGPDRLEADFAITDPDFLERPWEVHMVYLRHPILTRLVHDGDMFANDRSSLENDILAPGEGGQVVLDTSGFPASIELGADELDRIVGRYAFDGLPLELIVERRGTRTFFQVPPALTSFMPLFPETPLSFVGVGGGAFRFSTDEGGTVTGFEGSAPTGQPISGQRVP